MRKELEQIKDKKINFKGTIQRYGLKKEYIGGSTPTLLLSNVEIENDEKIEVEKIDHLWVNVGKTIYSLNIKIDSVISFSAWVKEYEKGYINHNKKINTKCFDYGIKRISNIEILKEGEGNDFNTFWKDSSKNNFLSNKIMIIDV